MWRVHRANGQGNYGTIKTETLNIHLSKNILKFNDFLLNMVLLHSKKWFSIKESIKICLNSTEMCKSVLKLKWPFLTDGHAYELGWSCFENRLMSPTFWCKSPNLAFENLLLFQFERGVAGQTECDFDYLKVLSNCGLELNFSEFFVKMKRILSLWN